MGEKIFQQFFFKSGLKLCSLNPFELWENFETIEVRGTGVATWPKPLAWALVSPATLVFDSFNANVVSIPD